MTRKVKITVLVCLDSVLIILANIFSYYYMSPFVLVTKEVLFKALAIQLILYGLLGFIFKVFNRINRYTSLKELISIFLTLFISYLVEVSYFVLTNDVYSQRYIFMTYLLSIFLICVSRITWRLLVEYDNARHRDVKKSENTIIIGAGAGGGVLLNALMSAKSTTSMNIVGMVDDDLNKVNTLYQGVKVLGTTKDLPRLIKDYEVKHVTIAIPSLKSSGFERIVDILKFSGVKLNSMPSLEEIVTGDVSVTRLREVDVIDLLGRDEVKLDMKSLANHLEGKVILITGAGGSIGSEICRQVMKFEPTQILLLGHGENSIYQIEKELRQTFIGSLTKITPLIADIQDKVRIQEIMSRYKPIIVYHAAAHKHVPLMEYNPQEAVKNNIYGTLNVASASKENKVESFVMVSTDKANNPPNVMGSTKRIAEMIVTGLNEEGKTKFSAVRFGNVLGSRGSVVPLFKEQIEKGGPITITDMRMTRYFMTIPEASRLVIQAGALAQGGEIFILDMGEPVKISNLAKKMIKLSGYTENEIEIVETGIRPGEKLYEELLVDKERASEQIFDKIFVGTVIGFPIDDVLNYIGKLPIERELLSRSLVSFANKSTENIS